MVSALGPGLTAWERGESQALLPEFRDATDWRFLFCLTTAFQKGEDKLRQIKPPVTVRYTLTSEILRCEEECRKTETN